jgi:hypothetical protein
VLGVQAGAQFVAIIDSLLDHRFDTAFLGMARQGQLFGYFSAIRSG